MTSDKNGCKDYLDETVRESFYLSIKEIQDIINSLKPKKKQYGYDGTVVFQPPFYQYN